MTQYNRSFDWFHLQGQVRLVSPAISIKNFENSLRRLDHVTIRMERVDIDLDALAEEALMGRRWIKIVSVRPAVGLNERVPLPAVV